MICVYPADCTDFSTNGNGTLAPLSAEVLHQRQRNPGPVVGGGHGNAEWRIRVDAGASH